MLQACCKHAANAQALVWNVECSKVEGIAPCARCECAWQPPPHLRFQPRPSCGSCSHLLGTERNRFGTGSKKCVNFFECRSAIRWQCCGNAFGNSAQSLTKVAASAPPLHSRTFKAATCRMPQHAAAIFILNVHPRRSSHVDVDPRVNSTSYPFLILSLYILSKCSMFVEYRRVVDRSLNWISSISSYMLSYAIQCLATTFPLRNSPELKSSSWGCDTKGTLNLSLSDNPEPIQNSAGFLHWRVADKLSSSNFAWVYDMYVFYVSVCVMQNNVTKLEVGCCKAKKIGAMIQHLQFSSVVFYLLAPRVHA